MKRVTRRASMDGGIERPRCPFCEAAATADLDGTGFECLSCGQLFTDLPFRIGALPSQMTRRETLDAERRITREHAAYDLLAFPPRREVALAVRKSKAYDEECARAQRAEAALAALRPQPLNPRASYAGLLEFCGRFRELRRKLEGGCQPVPAPRPAVDLNPPQYPIAVKFPPADQPCYEALIVFTIGAKTLVKLREKA